MIVSSGEALVDLVPDAIPGGGPMNVAIAAARLDVPTAFVGRVSTDEHGDAIWAHLISNRVDLRASERGPEPTTRAIVEHRPQLAFRFGGDNTADMNLSAVKLDRLDQGPHILHGGTLGLFRGRTAETLARLAETHDGLVSLDPNVRPQIIDDRDRWMHFHDRWIRHTHIYRGSDEDLAWIWPGRSLEGYATELLARGVKAVLVTRGPSGVSIFVGSTRIDMESSRVDVVDTVGAGDSFVAATLAQLHVRALSGNPDGLDRIAEDAWREIGSVSAAAAAITCSRPGADPPYRSELTRAGVVF